MAFCRGQRDYALHLMLARHRRFGLVLVKRATGPSLIGVGCGLDALLAEGVHSRDAVNASVFRWPRIRMGAPLSGRFAPTIRWRRFSTLA